MNRFEDSQEQMTIDIVDFIRTKGLWILGGVVVGAALGVAVAMLLPPRWEASATLQIGQVGKSPAGEPIRIEPPARTAERIGLGSFKAAIVRRLGLERDDRRAKLIRGSLVASANDRGDTVTFRVRDYSPEQAEADAEAVIASVQSTHRELAKPFFDRLAVQLEGTKADIERARGERERLLAVAKEGDQAAASDRFAESVLVGATLTQREAELRALKEQQLLMEEQLSARRNSETAPIEPVYVSDEPVWPKRSVFAVAGAIVGLFLAAFWVAITPGARSRRGALPS